GGGWPRSGGGRGAATSDPPWRERPQGDISSQRYRMVAGGGTMATELFAAMSSGGDVTVERLLEDDRSLVDSRDVEGMSPLLSALYRGRSAIASAILRRQPRLTVFE